MKSFPQGKNLLIFFVVTLLVLLFTFLSPSLNARLELLVQDSFFTLRGPMKPGDEVAIAVIDEKSIDKLGRWPWRRSVIADMVDNLSDYGVKVFGFDIVFSSPETSAGLEYIEKIDNYLEQIPAKDETLDKMVDEARAGSDNDLILYNSLKKSKRAVLGYFFHFSKEGLQHLSEAEMESYLKIIENSRYSGLKIDKNVKLKNVPLKQAYAVEASIEKISSSTKRAGYFNFQPDVDGSVRKVPMIVKYRDMVDLEGEDDYLFAPLTLTMLRKYLKAAIIISVDELGVKEVLLTGKESYVVPTNALGEMRINYYGPTATFPHYSIVDIIEGKIPKEKLDGKIIMIGATATAIEDLRITPFDKVFPGVEVHATIIDNILHGNALMDPDAPQELIDIVSVLLLGIILLLSIPRISPGLGGLIAFLLALSSFGAHYYLFAERHIVVNSVPPLLEAVLLYASLAIARFIAEEKEKRYIQDAFGHYLSPEVIKELVNNPDKLHLGGMRKEMTAFFSDIASFSSISEKLSPEELVRLLNEYLTAMTNIVLKYNGTVDKYEGDAIIAFFGAPLDDPEHARKCCLAALEMQEVLEEMRQTWKKEGRAILKVRMGINTGPIVVGNMGSETRMDYTIMGDAVNLASRLEGVNKQYGSYTMISHDTYESCKDLVEVRKLDSIRVVGKQEVTVIYELLCRKGALPEEKKNLIELYEKGRLHYEARNWEEAIEVFSQIIDIDPDDGPSLTYLERCLDFLINPPDPSWDGVHVMTSK